MNKRYMIVPLALCLLLSSCGKISDRIPEIETEAEEETEEGEIESETRHSLILEPETYGMQYLFQSEVDALEEDAVGYEEDFIYPHAELGDFFGSWQDSWSQRCSMEITREEGVPCVQISWGNSAYETYVWQMECEYDPERGLLAYVDGVCFIEGETRTILYENGTGLFYIQDGILYWKDDIEDAGADCRFEMVSGYLYSGTDNSYIYKASDSCLMTDTDVEIAKTNFWGELPSGKTIEQMIVNEIYARHGYDFQNEEIKAFFMNKVWYAQISPKTSDMDVIYESLNDFEKRNIEFLQK